MKLKVDISIGDLELSKSIGRFTWDEALSLQIEDWRLPSLDELKFIAEYFNSKEFFWSSTQVSSSQHFAWGFHFGDGIPYGYGISNLENVRLVRKKKLTLLNDQRGEL